MHFAASRCASVVMLSRVESGWAGEMGWEGLGEVGGGGGRGPGWRVVWEGGQVARRFGAWIWLGWVCVCRCGCRGAEEPVLMVQIDASGTVGGTVWSCVGSSMCGATNQAGKAYGVSTTFGALGRLSHRG